MIDAPHAGLPLDGDLPRHGLAVARAALLLAATAGLAAVFALSWSSLWSPATEAARLEAVQQLTRFGLVPFCLAHATARILLSGAALERARPSISHGCASSEDAVAVAVAATARLAEAECGGAGLAVAVAGLAVLAAAPSRDLLPCFAPLYLACGVSTCVSGLVSLCARRRARALLALLCCALLLGTGAICLVEPARNPPQPPPAPPPGFRVSAPNARVRKRADSHSD